MSLRISAVSYLNTFPFVYGIQKSGFLDNYHLDLDVPSICAEKLKNGAVDIALIPVGALPDLKSYEFITGYCIGAVSKVKTVLLLSHTSLDEIREIGLDYDSKTSVRLVQVLAKNYWNIKPEWKSLGPGEVAGDPGSNAIVAIGDKTFELVKKYPYCYDLAEEWINFTGLPFVFAAWVSTKKIPPELVASLNRALEFFKDKLPIGEDCKFYLEHNISYHFDEKKKEGLNLFLSYLNQ